MPQQGNQPTKTTKRKGSRYLLPFLFGDPNVNYPNTIYSIKVGFGFILKI